jgi:hypothetical protein
MSEPAYITSGIKTRLGQPLIGVSTTDGGVEVVRYFTSEEEADQELARDQDSIERALSLAGAWEELDAEDGPDPLDELDHMRHASNPSPPLKI